jgi:hypothetical protein
VGVKQGFRRGMADGPSALETGDRYARILEGLGRAEHARSNPRVLRASGVRIERMSAEKLRILAGNRQAWQANAWGYRDMIGELRFALQFRARAIARVQMYVAQVNPDDDEPLALSLRDEVDKDGTPTEKSKAITVSPALADAAEAELGRLPLDDGYGFTGVWSENFDVTGDCWLHGRQLEDGEEEWRIRSVMDVDVQGTTLTIKDELGQPRRLDLSDPAKGYEGSEELYRLWVPHPAHGHLADSALHATMDVLEEIALTGREIRAVSRSRIASNGVWPIPVGMTLLKNTKQDNESPEDQTSQFMANLTAAILAPISNEGDPGSVAPVIITGTREDIEVASKSFFRFDREGSPELIAKLQAAIKRMATSLDIPPEVLTGMAEVNHWTAWQIDAATFRHYLEPSIRLMVDSLTAAFLRPALIAQGFTPVEVKNIRIWYDAGQITENPNRRQDALDARDRAAISDDAFRTALGFNEGDAPTVEEQLLMVALKSGVDQSAAIAILAQWAKQQGEPDALPAIPEPAQIAPAARPAAPPAAQPDPAGTGGTGAPDSAPPAVRAAAPPEPGYRLDTSTARRLMDIDRALRDQLMADADAAITRALERAGARLRSKATRDPELTASLRDRAVPLTAWAADMGRQQALALGADVRFLLAQAWEELQASFARKVLNAIGQVTDLVASRLLGAAAEHARPRMAAELSSRVAGAWLRLQAELERHAEKLLFGEITDDEDGELPDFVVPPYMVRNALADVGGLPETSGGIANGRQITGEPINSLSTGTTVAGELEAAGVRTLGYLWVYGVTPQKRRFDPHWDLEGERFTSWSDAKLHPEPRYAWVGPFFRPGDHGGCMCDYVPGYAVPEYGTQVADRLRIPTAPTQELLNLAADDDKAGRRGTTAQEIRDQYNEMQALQSRFLNGE